MNEGLGLRLPRRRHWPRLLASGARVSIQLSGLSPLEGFERNLRKFKFSLYFKCKIEFFFIQIKPIKVRFPSANPQRSCAQVLS